MLFYIIVRELSRWRDSLFNKSCKSTIIKSIRRWQHWGHRTHTVIIDAYSYLIRYLRRWVGWKVQSISWYGKVASHRLIYYLGKVLLQLGMMSYFAYVFTIGQRYFLGKWCHSHRWRINTLLKSIELSRTLMVTRKKIKFSHSGKCGVGEFLLVHVLKMLLA